MKLHMRCVAVAGQTTVTHEWSLDLGELDQHLQVITIEGADLEDADLPPKENTATKPSTIYTTTGVESSSAIRQHCKELLVGRKA